MLFQVLRCDADLIVAAKKATAIGGDYHDHHCGDDNHYDGVDDHHDNHYDGDGDKRTLQEQH